MQHVNGNGNKDRGRVRARRGSVGCAVMAEVKGHRCSKKQMPDVSCYTASPADRDIIFIKPEVPFLLIGATERRGGQGGGGGAVKERIRGGTTAG